MATKISDLVSNAPAAALVGTDGFEVSQSGVSKGGTAEQIQTFVNKGLIPVSYASVSALLSAVGVAGQIVQLTTLAGGSRLVYFDGTNWRRVSDTGVLVITATGDLTCTVLSIDPYLLCTGTLAANRTITLSTTNAYEGARFVITRTGAGAFVYNVGTGPLTTLSQNQWCEVVYDGTAWYLAAKGSL